MDTDSWMWLYNFKLHVSAIEVYVTGDFDKWSRSHKMIQTSNGVFEKEIALHKFEELRYIFEVDGVVMLDPNTSHTTDADERPGNILTRQDCIPRSPVNTEIKRPVYERLDFDNWEIRVLSLKLQHDGPIKCSMKKVSLFNPGSYNALSYCWGQSRTMKTIILDEASVDVTANLYSALLNVKNHFESEPSAESVDLWVDALCINQADTEERSAQVRNMFRIYSRAERVLAFVGDPKDISWWPAYTSKSVAYLIKKRFNGQYVTDDGAPPLCLENGWRILNVFFNESYWIRAWVIQEIAVAWNITVLYGNSEITWNDIAALLTLWKNSPSSLPPNIRAYRRAVHLVEFRDRFLVAREPIRLLDALRWSYNTQATDSRDKIFALLGLCYDGQTFVPLPNYTQSFDFIMADMVKNIMRVNRSLDLICFKGPHFPKKSTGPTWLPNLFNLGHEQITSVEKKILEHNITCDSNPIVQELENFQLTVKSIKLHAITNISSAMTPYNKGDISVPYRQGWILETFKLADQYEQLANPQPFYLRKCETIWRILTLLMAPETLSYETVRYCFSILWTPIGRGAIHNPDLIRWIDTNAWFKIGDWTLREWSRMGFLSSVKPPKFSATDFNIFVESLEQVLRSGVRLCEAMPIGLNDPDDWIVCLVHPDAQLLDQLHCIQGCNFPIILRRNSALNEYTTYCVIGGADINRQWRGHFMDFIKGGKSPPGFKTRDIVLM